MDPIPKNVPASSTPKVYYPNTSKTNKHHYQNEKIILPY